LASLGAFLGNFAFSWILSPWFGADLIYAIRYGPSWFIFDLPVVVFRLGFPGILAMLFFFPRGPSWRFGATRAQWAAFLTTFLVSMGPAFSYSIVWSLEVWYVVYAIAPLATFIVSVSVHRSDRGAANGTLPFPALRVAALAALGSGILIAGILITRHLLESAYHSAFGLFLYLPPLVILYVLGFWRLKRGVLKPGVAGVRDFSRASPGLGLLAVPIAITAAYVLYYTAKIATGDLTLPKYPESFSGPQQNLTIIPAAIAGWIGLAGLALVLRVEGWLPRFGKRGRPED